MKNIGVSTLVNRNTFFAVFMVLGLSLASDASGSLSGSLAQGPGDRAIDQAQRAVRVQITRREGGRNPTVVFNSDAQTDLISNTGVRVRGTGAFSHNNDSRYANSRNKDVPFRAAEITTGRTLSSRVGTTTRNSAGAWSKQAATTTGS